MTAEQARERAKRTQERIFARIHDPSALKDKPVLEVVAEEIARALLLAQADGAEELAKVAAEIADGTAQSSAYLQGVADGANRVAVRAGNRAAELRRAAEGV